MILTLFILLTCACDWNMEIRIKLIMIKAQVHFALIY